MFKLLRFSLPLILAVFVLTGCRKQPPTPVTDGALGSGSQYDNGDLIPAGIDGGDWGTDDGLELRDGDAGIDMAEGTYNGRRISQGFGSIFSTFWQSKATPISLGRSQRCL